jgi:hypothetical protein
LTGLDVGFGPGVTTGLVVGSGPVVCLGVAVGRDVGVDVGFEVGDGFDVGFEVGGAVWGALVGVGFGTGFAVGFGAGVRDGRCVGRETTGTPGAPVSTAPGRRVGTTAGPVLGDGEVSALGEAIAFDAELAGVAAGDEPGEDETVGDGVGPFAVVVWLGVCWVAAGDPTAVPGDAPALRSGAVRSATLTASATETRSTLMMPSAMTARRRWAAVTSMRAPGAGGAAGNGTVSRW